MYLNVMYILTEFQYSKPEVSKIQQVGLAVNYHQESVSARH